MTTIDDIYNLHKKKYKNVSELTHITFKSTLNRLSKIYPELNNGDISGLLDVEATTNKLKESYKLNSIISTISNIIKLLRLKNADNSVISKYQQVLSDSIYDKNQQLDKQELTETRKDKFIDFDKMQNKVNELYDEYMINYIQFTPFRRFLVFNLFIRNIPVRLGNYLNMKIIRTPTKEPKDYNNKDFNYILLYDNNYIFVFNKYKTSKTYNQKIVKITDNKMIHLINKWLTYNNTKSFIINYDNSPSNQKNLTADLKHITEELFDKSFSIDLIRSSYITYLYSTNPNLITKCKVSDIMGHSIITAEKHYNKLVDENHKRDALGLPIN